MLKADQWLCYTPVSCVVLHSHCNTHLLCVCVCVCMYLCGLKETKHVCMGGGGEKERDCKIYWCNNNKLMYSNVLIFLVFFQR